MNKDGGAVATGESELARATARLKMAVLGIKVVAGAAFVAGFGGFFLGLIYKTAYFHVDASGLFLVVFFVMVGLALSAAERAIAQLAARDKISRSKP